MNALFADVEAHLRRAATVEPGDIYRSIQIREQPFPALHYTWDSRDRVVVISFARNEAELTDSLSQFRLLEASLLLEHVYKKLHLILFHATPIGRRLEGWPAGLTVNPIGVTPEDLEKPLAPQLRHKLMGILILSQSDVAISNQDEAESLETAPNWRYYLSPERIDRLIGTLPDVDDHTRKSLRRLARQLLTLTEKTPPEQFPTAVTDFLNRRWEGRSHED